MTKWGPPEFPGRIRRRRRRYISDALGVRAVLHVATHQVFTCYGCERPQPKGTEYVGATTLAGQRVKTCSTCWLAGLGRER